QTHVLNPHAMARTSAVVREFKRQAARFKPRCVRVLATSAAREAANQDNLVVAARQASVFDCPARKSDFVFAQTLSTPFHKCDHVCGEGFLAQTRRERGAYPS